MRADRGPPRLWVVRDGVSGTRRVGFGGVAVLAGTPGFGGGGLRVTLGIGLVPRGSAAWAAGSLYLRQLEAPRAALLWVSMQMLMGGAVLGLVSLMAGELPDVHFGEMTGRSLLAGVYLILFGSLIAYSAYVWLLRVTTPARVGTYAYVNPIIALFLGWALPSEPIRLASVVAVMVILGSVIVIVSESRVLGVRGLGVKQVGE